MKNQFTQFDWTHFTEEEKRTLRQGIINEKLTNLRQLNENLQRIDNRKHLVKRPSDTV